MASKIQLLSKIATVGSALGGGFYSRLDGLWNSKCKTNAAFGSNNKIIIHRKEKNQTFDEEI